MRRFKTPLATAAAAATALVLGTAAPAVQAWGVGVRAGTQGLGGDIGVPLNDNWSLRLGASTFNWDRTLEVTDVRYDARLKLQNVSALVEWHPIGPLRVSAGVVPTRNRMDIAGQPVNTQYRINGNVYQPNELRDLRGEIRSGKSVAPYLGLGYGIVAKRGFNLYLDVGAMYQGSPDARLSATCGSGLTAARCQQLQTDVLAEQRQLAEKVRNWKWFPVANIGVTIGF